MSNCKTLNDKIVESYRTSNLTERRNTKCRVLQNVEIQNVEIQNVKNTKGRTIMGGRTVGG
jgi:hypothetical protein